MDDFSKDFQMKKGIKRIPLQNLSTRSCIRRANGIPCSEPPFETPFLISKLELDTEFAIEKKRNAARICTDEKAY